MSELFRPLTIREITFKNRIAVSPMCQYSSVDGFANDWHLVHLGSRATGGAGLVISEATAVSPEGRITPDDLGIWKAEHVPELQRITAFLEAQGAVPGIQLAHAGRKASHQSPWKGRKAIPANEEGWQTVPPSAMPFLPSEPAPIELDAVGIVQVIADFKAAAQRALEAGFKVAEVHAAHGYLLHEFYSPLSNKRTDRYGGSFENRIRLSLEVTEAVREVWPKEYPLFVRISATDWTEGGWTGEDAVELAKALRTKGADLIDCSTGGNVPKADIPVGPCYQTRFATRIKKEADILTGAVGMITTAQEAESIIAEGRADLVLLARKLLRDPHFPLHVAQELGADVTWPLQYERAKPRP
ncbi:2,4-dienoyl-CoA reductase-like NADH-dependent reductase (Old Yellow Enzyme family) [Pontibacter ummariensis]|uniref:2,4-dienoyl-CoA reductase n=1 Tax=Pontibacter ummariensis TaxID=1610492 RepID=A0A239KYI2_9BACT|nr:NADH:flavin oxidoreductase/NADH oxidase [Pontibacter ummariensis]PRY04644.1 2,4-dienoyl-CoA reductase-like NADH-dependent reductase (Old Yellow Enzyme family) [Pontibacter ummariensis]SNT23427.1 2,4-dienoyl-CoA reductase [Pontibacter ummariensis]